MVIDHIDGTAIVYCEGAFGTPNGKTANGYDGFDNYPIASLDREIQILELLAQKPVIALTINHERMTDEEIKTTIADYEARYERPTTDVLKDGCGKLVDTICRLLA